MKTKINALALVMTLGLSPAAFSNNMDKSRDHDTSKKTGIPTSSYNDRGIDEMDETDSGMLNNRRYNRESTVSQFGDNSKFMKKDVVKQVQEKLNDNNFSVGSTDGIYGPKTRSALMDFQRSEDLEVTGRLNQETLDAMDIDSNFSRTDRDMYSE